MEKHASNDINYLKINQKDLKLLGNIRHWKNIKIAFDENYVWVKNISDGQLNTLAIQCIPSKVAYYQNGSKLFLKGSLLPDCPIPNLLWTPIERGLAVHLPPFNHNYFGTKKPLNIKIIPSIEEQPVFAMLTTFDALKTFIETAAAIRLKNLSWSIVEEKGILIIGQPSLPIQGITYWRQQDSFIPVGYRFNYPSLSTSIHQAINSEHLNWIIWEPNSECFKIPKKEFQLLTLSSFRRSFNLL